LSSLFDNKDFIVSYELFPPKTEKGEKSLYRHVEKLMAFKPDFITCTYGAGGSTRDRTLGIVSEVKKRFGVPVASHLTVVGSTVDELRGYLRAVQERGVDYIVALRGDPPHGEETFTRTEGGLSYANELVSLIRSEFPQFGIAVAGYPEVHREAPDADTDLLNLKRKVDCGADIIVTQLFYDNDDFFRFHDRCREAGIDAPIVPGLLPVTSLKQIQRIASLCGARLPEKFVERLGEKDDPEWQFEVGVEQAIEQTRELIERGVCGLHFYVLNKSDATSRILESIQLPRPAV
ncbi:MAG: methylenetetrahydrofolate reductase [NAD(P)H], partial [Planctomycetota bacterium]